LFYGCTNKRRVKFTLGLRYTVIKVLEFYCVFDLTGAREFVRATRKTGPDDLLNSAIAGFGTGALLGRIQG
jgi:hypothetical protein